MSSNSSPSDILKLLQMSKIINNVLIKYLNATDAEVQMKIFTEDISDFQRRFLELCDLVERYGKPLPFPVSEVNETLHGCDQVLKEYRGYLDGARTTTERLLRSLNYRHRKDIVDKLKDRLIGHVQVMDYCITFLRLQLRLEVFQQAHLSKSSKITSDMEALGRDWLIFMDLLDEKTNMTGPNTVPEKESPSSAPIAHPSDDTKQTSVLKNLRQELENAMLAEEHRQEQIGTLERTHFSLPKRFPSTSSGIAKYHFGTASQISIPADEVPEATHEDHRPQYMPLDVDSPQNMPGRKDSVWKTICRKVQVERISSGVRENRECDLQWSNQEGFSLSIRAVYRDTETKSVRKWSLQSFHDSRPVIPWTRTYPDGDVTIHFPKGLVGHLEKGVNDVMYTFSQASSAAAFQTLLYTNNGKLFDAVLLFDRPIRTIRYDENRPECRISNIQLWRRQMHATPDTNSTDNIFIRQMHATPDTNSTDNIFIHFFANALSEEDACWIEHPHYAFEKLDLFLAGKWSDRIVLRFLQIPDSGGQKIPLRRATNSLMSALIHKNKASVPSPSLHVKSWHPFGYSRLEITFQHRKDKEDFKALWVKFETLPASTSRGLVPRATVALPTYATSSFPRLSSPKDLSNSAGTFLSHKPLSPPQSSAPNLSPLGDLPDPAITLSSDEPLSASQAYISNQLSDTNADALSHEHQEKPNLRPFETNTPMERSSKLSHEHEVNSCMGPHLLSDLTDSLNTKSWKGILEKVPKNVRWDLEYVEPYLSRSCWTLTPSSDLPPESIPSTIAGAPVVIPVPFGYDVRSAIIPPPDPHPRFISPSATLQNEVISDLFETYDNPVGFYVMINGWLQIIVDDGFDTSYALSHRPRTFGGLRVSYIQQSFRPSASRTTSGPSTQITQAWSSSDRAPDAAISGPGPNTPMLHVGGLIEAEMKGNPRKKDRFQGRVGVMSTCEEKLYLTVPTHLLTEAWMAAKGTKVPETSWINDVTLSSACKSLKDTKIAVTFDTEAKAFPNGFVYDTSLVDITTLPNLHNALKCPNTAEWLSDAEWNNLSFHYPSTSLHFLSDPAKSARNIPFLDSENIIIGQAIFNARHKDTQKSWKKWLPMGKKSSTEPTAENWRDYVAHALLFRVEPRAFGEPDVASGTAVCVLDEDEGGEKLAKVAGFTSFVQDVYNYGRLSMDDNDVKERLRENKISFYGAFRVPKEMREKHRIV